MDKLVFEVLSDQKIEVYEPQVNGAMWTIFCPYGFLTVIIPCMENRSFDTWVILESPDEGKDVDALEVSKKDHKGLIHRAYHHLNS